MANHRLSEDQLAAADRAIIARIKREPAMASELSAAASRAVGELRGDPCCRHVDRWLQRARRKGWASFMRDGRRIFWSLTEAGQREFSRETEVGA